ncbi:hypothetical protein [Actinobacillus suis]|uniref:Type II secretory pathway, component PulJ n=2 Tax=Actinobacillus suis TaxID=716 RepID=K0FYW1_ACTSU|nr:hypothetical protein [Actinobacillus suis]AFU19742.1 hypothetical protein ASU2_08040 [Actinobacillus suis H91-0380]MCO4166185.1 hypothetical protein [Actinobacillus suis]MCO4169486.1 hypothetical protein [Actinobacillus suis]MCQ9629349.1 hypothetical protein [Actinobacillus suis]MCQ9632399.1 hypothetical protein [Actinobacillus suis]
MSCQNINAVIVKNRLSAFSLIELLLSLSLSISLLLLTAKSYTQFTQNNVKQKELLFLQKEAHQIIHYFQQHIQHLGFQGSNRENSNFYLFEKENKRYALDNKSCLIFFYDLNSDGCLGKRKTKNSLCVNNEINNTHDLAKEIFGFKIESQEIYIYDKNNLTTCKKHECEGLLNACQEKWKKFTSIEDFKVDKLSFSWKDPEKIMQVTLKLISVKQNNIEYSTTNYIYILN